MAESSKGFARDIGERVNQAFGPIDFGGQDVITIAAPSSERSPGRYNTLITLSVIALLGFIAWRLR